MCVLIGSPNNQVRWTGDLMFIRKDCGRESDKETEQALADDGNSVGNVEVAPDSHK